MYKYSNFVRYFENYIYFNSIFKFKFLCIFEILLNTKIQDCKIEFFYIEDRFGLKQESNYG